MRSVADLISSRFILVLLIGTACLVAPVSAVLASTNPSQCPPDNPFYTYNASKPLAEIPPGTVLDSRQFTYWGLWWPVTAVQLLYRSTGVSGQPTTNVTSVILPADNSGPTRAVSLQTAYDSLNCMDEPSVTIWNQGGISGVTNLHNAGYTVIVTDTEGQHAHMTEGHEYGMNTLDGIRAAINSPLTELTTTTPVALMGYSGGAWATEWAAQLAPTYAPDINSQLVGAAIGGVPVDAAHIARYLSGSANFSAELPAALIGLTRAFDFDITPYLSPKGLEMYHSLQGASLADAMSMYGSVTIAEMFKPAYSNANSIPGYTAIINQENLGLVPPATIPLYIVQGNSGWIDGTQPGPEGIGKGDGATVTGDVRTLARQACAAGTPVSYHQLDYLDHLMAAVPWSFGARSWIKDRFNGVPAPNNCSTIAPGNSLAPEQPVPAG